MPAKGSKEKKAGNPNWKKPILYKVVKTILPTTNAHWTRVIKKYQKLSGDKSSREVKTVQRYWKETMCLNSRPMFQEAPNVFSLR
jgi:hypothetical protein